MKNETKVSTRAWNTKKKGWVSHYENSSYSIEELDEYYGDLKHGRVVYLRNVLTQEEATTIAQAVCDGEWVESMVENQAIIKKKKTHVTTLQRDISSNDSVFLKWVPESVKKIFSDLQKKLHKQHFSPINKEAANQFLKSDKNATSPGKIHVDNSTEDLTDEGIEKGFEGVWEGRHLFTLWIPLEAPLHFWWKLPMKKKKLLKRKVLVGDGVFFSQTAAEHGAPLSTKIRVGLTFVSDKSIKLSQAAKKRNRDNSTFGPRKKSR